MPRVVALRYDDAFRMNFKDENRAVVKATQGKHGTSWRGPIFAYCGEMDESGEIEEVENMDMET